ncbi:hypothetical protein BST81_11520 [Leptolyngbya sp. 'hensonii']|nr:hypothetical protein BST81_11520 [Leptolyngbya sp. 'hensonii']
MRAPQAAFESANWNSPPLSIAKLRIVDLITPKFSALTPNPQPLPLSQRERGQGGEGNQEFIGVI